jgi:uncharacterized protein
MSIDGKPFIRKLSNGRQRTKTICPFIFETGLSRYALGNLRFFRCRLRGNGRRPNKKRSENVNLSRSAMRVATVVAAASIVAGMAACTDQHDVAAQSRSISVTGQGEASGAPDQAEVSAGVQILADTVIEASRENQAIIEKIMTALEEQGIPEERIQTSNYSIWAEQDYQEPRQNRIAGYRVSNVVTVRIDDVGKIGDVLAAVTNAGANSIHGIQFGVKDTAALERTARQAAMADARVRAESLAELAGVQLGEVLSISTSYSGGPPRPMMARSYEMADAAAPAPGISPGQQSVSVQIHATFAIR